MINHIDYYGGKEKDLMDNVVVFNKHEKKRYHQILGNHLLIPRAGLCSFLPYVQEALLDRYFCCKLSRSQGSRVLDILA